MNQIREQISKLVQDVHDGNESAAKAFSILKTAKDVLESGLKVIEDSARIEALEFNKGEVYFGGTWEIRNTATYLDFSKDEVYVNLNQAASARKKILNEAFKHQEGQAFFDKESGEEIPILPVKTPSKQVVIFKQKS